MDIQNLKPKSLIAMDLDGTLCEGECWDDDKIMQRVKDAALGGKELIEWVCTGCTAVFESDEYKDITVNEVDRIQDVCPVCKTILERDKNPVS